MVELSSLSAKICPEVQGQIPFIVKTSRPSFLRFTPASVPPKSKKATLVQVPRGLRVVKVTVMSPFLSSLNSLQLWSGLTILPWDVGHPTPRCLHTGCCFSAFWLGSFSGCKPWVPRGSLHQVPSLTPLPQSSYQAHGFKSIRILLTAPPPLSRHLQS